MTYASTKKIFPLSMTQTQRPERKRGKWKTKRERVRDFT